MRIETLREFIAVALCQSLTKASRELFVAQSTLSAHMASIEKDLGFSVFDHRPGNAVSLTNAGWDFFQSAQRIVEMYDEAVAQGRRDTKASAPLRIIAGSFGKELMQALDAIQGFETVALEGEFKALFDFSQLAKDDGDIILGCDYSASPAMTKEAEDLGIAHEPLGFMNMKLVLMADHPLACRTSIRSEDLAGYRVLITDPSSSPSYIDAINAFMLDGVTLKPSIRPQLSSLAEMRRRGFGTDLFFLHAKAEVESISRANGIVEFHELDGKPMRLPLVASYRKKCRDWRYDALFESLCGIEIGPTQ